ncbi:MAG: hypothetical protein INR71_12865, partial [Terriglobus roseus]|nr:hypothetical protein [Terriglobus roseus]
MEADLRARIPGLDPVVADYSVGFLKFAAENDYTSDAPAAAADAVESVSELLTSASGDLSDENAVAIHKLVEGFLASLTTGSEGRQHAAPASARRLDQTIHVGSQRNISSTLGLTGASVDLESANARKVESRVDRKKLEKAERKLRAKQDRKTFKTVEYEA